MRHFNFNRNNPNVRQRSNRSNQSYAQTPRNRTERQIRSNVERRNRVNYKIARYEIDNYKSCQYKTKYQNASNARLETASNARTNRSATSRIDRNATSRTHRNERATQNNSRRNSNVRATQNSRQNKVSVNSRRSSTVTRTQQNNNEVIYEISCKTIVRGHVIISK